MDGFAEIVNSKNYPSFRLNLVESGFTIGEKIIINNVERVFNCCLILVKILLN